MKTTNHAMKFLVVLLAVAAVVFAIPYYAKAAEVPATSACTATTTTDRAAGICSYTVQGIEQLSKLTLQVAKSDDKTIVLTREITLTNENCANGTYTDSFTLGDVKYAYGLYDVSVLAGNVTVAAGTCDFSIHTQNIALAVSENKGVATRTFKMVSTEPQTGVIVPGSGNEFSVLTWPKGVASSAAVEVGEKKTVSYKSLSWKADMTKAGNKYGTWKVKLLLTNTLNTSVNVNLLQTTYEVNPVCKSFTTTKTQSQEKNKSFGIVLKGLKNPYKIKSVTFNVYNSKGKKVTSVKGKAQNDAATQYNATVSLKKLGYAFDNYTIRAVVADSNGLKKTLTTTTAADETVQKGVFSVTKKKNATSIFKVSNVYIPGGIKDIKVTVYQTGSKTKKIGTYSMTADPTGKKYTVTAKNADVGSFKAKVYGYTNWGTKVLLTTQTYKLSKKNMGKNGWYYETYNGKKYKFYYVNNEKQTDLTKVLGIKESNSTNTNNFYIELNRAACVVTVYMYNDETKQYDIPVKVCTVSVGRDVRTTAGVGGLNVNTSYTPIGTYSICTNGQSVKYTLKTMNEPDGSICYARWTTHIVGNVYFHAIAVGAQSHYALSSSTYNRLGTPASAGCIRMTVADAKWIYDYASKGSTVKIVTGSTAKPGPLGKPATITSKVNYDPTDPEVPDSKKKADYKAGKISGYMTKSGKKVGY